MDNRSSYGAPEGAAAIGHGGVIPALAELAVNRMHASFTVEGNGAVRALAPLPRGAPIFLRFTGTPTFVNSMKLLMPGGVDKTFAAGDCAMMQSIGNGNWRCLAILPNAGLVDLSNIPAARGNLNLTVAPQGRLTLTSGTPVMAASQANATTLFYTAYTGTMIPIYSPSGLIVPSMFSELSIALSDTTKNPAAVGNNQVHDWFVWNDAGTLRLSHGPAWTNATTRSMAVVRVFYGFLTNNAAITNGPAQYCGTYVGTTYSNASGGIDFIFGGLGASGVAASFNIWNAYNRVPILTTVGDTTDTWVQATGGGAWRAANGSAAMRVSFVRGFDEDGVTAEYHALTLPAGTPAIAYTGVGLDTTGGYSGSSGYATSALLQQVVARYSGLPGIGFHFLSANEACYSANGATWYGDAGAPASLQTGFHAELWA